MWWTRLSLSFPTTYLLVSGLGNLGAPLEMLRLAGSTGSYSPAFVRFSGALLVTLGLIFLAVVARRVEALYLSLLLVRTVPLATVTWLYLETHDVLFLMGAATIAFGMLMTTLALIADRKSAT
jgi:uncharacterized protein YjeT (DUF2065 family)